MSLTQIRIPSTICYTTNNGAKNVFEIHEKLGQGGFAAVYRATLQNTKKTYAIKVIPKEQFSNSRGKSMMEKLQVEIKIQKKLNHPNIVHSKLYFSDENNHYIVLEYCPGKSVRDYLRKSEKGHLSEPETRKIINDVIEGLCYLHNREIIHHDLKLENFLIGSDGKVKIADFGLATALKNEDEKRQSICGTPNYISPEIIMKQNRGKGFEVDIWALGVAAFIMLTGKPPFDGGDKLMTYENIKSCEYQFPSKIQISSEAKHFIRSILKIDPNKRPTAIDLIDHPFLSKFDKVQIQLYRPNRIPIPQSFSTTESPQKVPNNLYSPSRYSPHTSSNQSSNSRSGNSPVRIRSFSNLSGSTNRYPLLNNFSSPISEEYDSSLKNSYLSNAPYTNENNESNNSVSNNISKNFVIPSYVVTKHLFQKDDLIYLLGDGTVGICFEDQSRIVIDPHEKFAQYYKSPTSYAEVVYLDKQRISTQENVDQNTKVKILDKISLVQTYSKSFKKFKYLYELPENNLDSSFPLSNVKNFSKKDDSVLFKFNNKNIQVNFGDFKKLMIFWNSKKMCIFRVIKEKCQLFSLNEVANMNSNCEEISKLKKAKELLSVHDRLDLGL